MFAQGERTLDRSEGGLGIGLTLARRIVELHGGAITARSEGAGKGAEFTILIPRLNLEFAQPRPVASAETPSSAQRRPILVVDDNVDAADTMAMLLRLDGHEVETVHEGESALKSVAARMPDIVLLDIGLPGMSGYETELTKDRPATSKG